MSNVFSTAWAGFKTLLAFSPLGLIAPAWRGVRGFFGGLWDGIIERARAALDWLLGKFRAVTGVIRDSWQTVTGWFGGNDDEARPARRGINRRGRGASLVKPVALATATAATPMPAAPVAASIDEVMRAQAAGRPAVTQKVTYEGAQITVHAAPGMSEAQVAEIVVRKQDEAQRRTKRRARGRMHDGIGGAF